MKISTMITGMDLVGNLMLAFSAVIISPILSILCIVNAYVRAQWLGLGIVITALINIITLAVSLYRLYVQNHINVEVSEE